MGMLTIEEWVAEIERLDKERDALDLKYQEVRVGFAEIGDTSKAGEEPGHTPRSEALLFQLMTALETERTHVEALWRLLADALQRNFRDMQT
jgi:hypothetical protein